MLYFILILKNLKKETFIFVYSFIVTKTATKREKSVRKLVIIRNK